MAYAALLSLAQTTGKIILDQDKYPISQNKKQHIRSIYKPFIFLKEFVEDFPEKANNLDRRIRDAAYEAEDVIESFMLDDAPSHWLEVIAAKFKFKRQMRKIREETDSITREVMMVMKNNNTLGDSSVAGSPSRISSTSTINHMVGLHDDLKAIQSRLCGESHSLQVIPIVGMGGIGKTTLAKYAYDDPLIVERFDIRAWTTVSQDYSVDVILSGLLASMEEFNQEGSESELVSEKVFKILKGRRYLIVMDDIWSTDAWDDVFSILPDDGNGSRVMLTTRLTDVAAYAGHVSPIHQMKLMDDDQSWSLLQQKASAPLELESIGKEIARSCKGLPLAIVVVAGLLSTVGNNPPSWREIAENVVNPVATEGQLENILSLSYTHLPHYLRPCFLYMGIFPEDSEVRVSKLVKLWAAEGFLRLSKGSKTPEEEAEECLEDLVKRSLVLVTKRKADGRIKSCSLHDLMRDLCIKKAHQEKFLVNLSSGGITKLLVPMKKLRRVSITPSSFSYLSKVNCSTIHTVLCFHGITVAYMLQSFRLLRVLDAIGANVTSLPDELFDLFHLAYLAIYYLGRIPAAISKLQNLQTFNLRTRKDWRLFKAHSVCLPQEIWSMRQLRHLAYYGWLPEPEGRKTNYSALGNLQTLSIVLNAMCSEGILRMMPNLRKLEMDCSECDIRLDNLVHLRQLRDLKLRSSFHLGRDDAFSFPHTLTKLTLSCFPLPWEEMTIVGSLPKLQVLKLTHRACKGSEWITREGEFPQLEFLLIEKSGLERWVTESSHFPRLKSLVLVECWQLAEIPQDIGEISTLQLIEVKGQAKRSLVESAKRILDEQQQWGNDALQVRCMAR